MEVVYQRCAGIDVHQSFFVVCLSSIEGEKRQKAIRSFRNETADLLALRAWLLQEGCSAVGMESTGVYTPPIIKLGAIVNHYPYLIAYSSSILMMGSSG
jgi:transposase